MPTHTFRLGGPRARRRRTDALRSDALVFESPHGLGRCQALLVQALPKRCTGPALFGMDTEGAVAMAAQALWPAVDCRWFHVDAYAARKVERVLADNDVDGVVVAAAEDPPAGPFEVVALPFPAGGEALLMRDLLEAAHDALRVGGRLVAATDGKPDALRKALGKVFGKFVPASPFGKGPGACFYALRRRERDVRSDHAHVRRAVFAAPDASETVVEVESRPGTFSHATVDRGTRSLAEWWQPRGEDAVLDLGAGCGTLGLLAAVRLPEARVVLVDSNARAIGCARRNAVRNGCADRVEALVRADFEDVPPGPEGGYALCLANPPYFGDKRIARSFAEAARSHLRAGGRLALVTRAGRASELHRGIVDEVFGFAREHDLGAYRVVEART